MVPTFSFSPSLPFVLVLALSLFFSFTLFLSLYLSFLSWTVKQNRICFFLILQILLIFHAYTKKHKNTTQARFTLAFHKKATKWNLIFKSRAKVWSQLATILGHHSLTLCNGVQVSVSLHVEFPFNFPVKTQDFATCMHFKRVDYLRLFHNIWLRKKEVHGKNEV